MDLKEIFKLGIEELSKEPSSCYKVINDLIENYEKLSVPEILQKLNSFDIYVYEFLNKEEYYAEISKFPKIELLKSDIAYYRSTYYRIRYHYIYYDDRLKKFTNVLSYGLHLASNLKEWLDFHFKTLDEELIHYLQEELQKLDSGN